MTNNLKLTCLIDDDPIFLFGTQKLMELENFSESYVTYDNGEDAINSLKAINEQKGLLPDVILLDLNMPIMDGWQFLEELERLSTPKKLTVYIVTSSVDPSDLERVTRYSAVKTYLVKPITSEVLEQIKQEIIPTNL